MKLRIDFILFVSLSFAVFKILIVNVGVEQQEFEFPTLNTPDIDCFGFSTSDTPVMECIDLSGGCSGFIDCTEYLANAVINIGVGIIFIVLLLVGIMIFIFEFFILFAAVTFSGIDGAPWYVNLLIVTPFAAGASLITYKLIRRGSSAT